MIRAFFGIPLLNAVTQQILQVSARFQHELAQELRWINPTLWHITVKFFAAVEPQALANISQVAEKIARQTAKFRLQIKKIAVFPRPQGRIVAAYLKPNAVLRDMYLALDSAGTQMGIKHESRRYRPHITLAKFRSNSYHLEPVICESFYMPVNELVLYESRPAAEESLYIPLHRFELLD